MTDQTNRSTGTIQAGSVVGTLWFIGWLFTVGFAELIWWQGIMAVILWPYFLGDALR